MAHKKSPCISVCAIDPGTGFCLGCGRNRQEIASWKSLDDQGRQKILKCLPERLAALPPANTVKTVA